jgi:hypothetical protein
LKPRSHLGSAMPGRRVADIGVASVGQRWIRGAKRMKTCVEENRR